jgi:hypothetical protein
MCWNRTFLLLACQTQEKDEVKRAEEKLRRGGDD